MDYEAPSGINDDYNTPEKRVAAWNAYRKENPDFVPDLKDADLSRAELRGINLRRAHLENTTLAGAKLEGAEFTFAHLKGINLIDALLENADFRCADLERSDLRSAKLEHAIFMLANLEKALLNAANIESADLRNACLKNSVIVGARLKNAKLGSARLEDANLMDAAGYRFDSTFIRNCTTSRDAKEPWLVLRRSYTGPKLLFILFLLSLFLVPYGAKTLWWVGVNKGQAVTRVALAERRAELEADASAGAPAEEARELAVMEEAAVYLAEVDETWERWQTWQLVLGVDKGWPYWITAALILTYNALRIYLTWQVSALRHEEELGGPSPPYRTSSLGARFEEANDWSTRAGAFREWFGASVHSIVWLYGCHTVARTLMLVAFASGAFHLGYWLTRPVLLPPG